MADHDHPLIERGLTMAFQRCRYCGTFVTSVGGLRPHEQICGGGGDDFPKLSVTGDEEGEEEGRKPVTFPLLRVKLRRLSPAEIEGAVGVKMEVKVGQLGLDSDSDVDPEGHQVQGGRRALRRQSGLKARLKIREVACLMISGPTGSKTEKEFEDRGEADLGGSNPDDLDYLGHDDDNDDQVEDEDMDDYFNDNEIKAKPERRRGRKTTSKARGSRPGTNSGTRMKANGFPVRKISDEIYSINCQKCPAFFATQQKFDIHNECVHEDPSHQSDIHTCPICDRMIWTQLTFQSHLKYHTNAEAVEDELKLWEGWPQPKKKGGSVNFTCKHCLMSHSHHHSFLTHMNAKHSDKGRSCTWTCRYCSTSSASTPKEEFHSLKELVWHIRNNHHKEYFGKTLKWDDRNLKNEDRPKRNCDICGKLMDVYYMKIHKIKEHSSVKTEPGTIPLPPPPPQIAETINPEENKFQCPLKQCETRLKTFPLLKCHFICHLEHNPFACKVPGCDVQCGAQCHLDRHMKIHTGEARIVCPKCGLSFCTNTRLLTHICEEVDKAKIRHYADGSKRSNRAKLRLKRCPKSEIPGLAANQKSKWGRSRVDINKIILEDPVFINACEENPEFEKLMKANIKIKSSNNSSYCPTPTNCPECGKEFSSVGSVQRHCLSSHGMKLLKSRGGPSRKAAGAGVGAKSKGKRKVSRKRKYDSSDDSDHDEDGDWRMEEEKFRKKPAPVATLIKVEPELSIDADLVSHPDPGHYDEDIVDSSETKVEPDIDPVPVVKIEKELEVRQPPYIKEEIPDEEDSKYF